MRYVSVTILAETSILLNGCSEASATYIDEHETVSPVSDGQVNCVKAQATYTDIQNPKDYKGALDVLDVDYLYSWGVLTGNSSYQNVDNGITLISDFVASHVEGY